MPFINKRHASKGHVLITILNVLILLGIALFSFSFNTLMENKFAQKAKARQQARFNAESGIAIARLKLLRKAIDKIPFEEEFVLHGNRDNTALVKIDYIGFKKTKAFYKFERMIKSRYVRLSSVGAHKNARHLAIAVLHAGGGSYKPLFCYGQAQTGTTQPVN